LTGWALRCWGTISRRGLPAPLCLAAVPTPSAGLDGKARGKHPVAEGLALALEHLFIVFLFCLSCVFCLSGCGGYTLEGTWKVNPLVEVEFRSDGSISAWGQKQEGLTWHGDYICLKADIKKIRDARTESLTQQKKALVDRKKKLLVQQAESKKYYFDVLLKTHEEERAHTQPFPTWEQFDKMHNKKDEEQLEREVKLIDQQLEDLKNGKVMEGMEGCYNFPLAKGVDKKDIVEFADKVEVRIHWVDADHFDLGSTSFSRVKLPK